MPEDYQALLGELGVDTTTPAPVVNTVEPEAVPETPATDPTNIPGTETTPVEPATDPAITDPAAPIAPPEIVDQAQEARNSAFAEMRVQNAKYQKAIAQVAKAMGSASEDEAIEKLMGASLDVQGKRENIDPVVLKRLNDLEEKNAMLDTATKTSFIKESFGAVQKKFNLPDADVIKFAQKLTDQNVDIFNSNVPLDVLYLGLNYDTLKTKMLEAEKQNWIKGQTEADKAPGVNPATGKPIDKEKKDISTEADLELVLKTLKSN